MITTKVLAWLSIPKRNKVGIKLSLRHFSMSHPSWNSFCWGWGFCSGWPKLIVKIILWLWNFWGMDSLYFCYMGYHANRHGKSGDLGDPGLWKILQIVEDLNKMTKNVCIKGSPWSKSCPNKTQKVNTAIKRSFEI